MICGMPQTVQEIAALLESEPDATFVRVRFKDELLLALRDDQGVVTAYHCTVNKEISTEGQRGGG